jgi:DNA-binding protein YbaB
MTAAGPDWDRVLDPDSAREQLTAWKGEVDRLAAGTKAMADGLEQLRTTGRDGNDLAEVTIDSTGVLVDLHLTERIARVAPEVVSRAVMSALRVARQEAAGRAREIIAETVGTESVAARTIAEQVSRRLDVQDPDADPRGGGR